MPNFSYSDLLPLGEDTTQYRLVSREGVSVVKLGDKEFLQVDAAALEKLTSEAIHDINHYLRAEHLQQLTNIIKDPESSPNDRFVAIDLLKNANIAAGGVLPMCQDTGTALVMGKKGQFVLTNGKDEDDLIGGFRLVNGETVWQDGPVITAMSRGAVLLLDEVDLGSNKMMCLQPVLEGKAVYLKKTNRVVHPAPGFNVIATANTKGKGSDDGRFIGTNVMNEAFLERFSITMEQEYPSTKVETKILNNVLGASGVENKDFVDKLVTWADVIRKSFYEGALSEIISTRRLVHICEAFSIFGENKMKAIELCLNRFDVDTKNSFIELYKKVDETVDPVVATTESAPVSEEIAF